jgi:hypothetical protein
MSLAKLKLISRLRSKTPSAKLRRSEEAKDYEAYLQTLSSEELEALYNARMAELNNDPEVIANMERWSKMTYEELINEYYANLKAS